MINKFPNMIVIATKIDQHICAFELQYIKQSSFTPLLYVGVVKEARGS